MKKILIIIVLLFCFREIWFASYQQFWTNWLMDSDNDWLINFDDNCFDVSNISQEDTDKDWVWDVCDNCVNIKNPDQKDSNWDGIWDACEKTWTWWNTIKSQEKGTMASSVIIFSLGILLFIIFNFWLFLFFKRFKNNNLWK